MTDSETEPRAPEKVPPTVPPPAVGPVNWATRAGVGFGIAVAIFVLLDGLFWFILRATGLLPSNFYLSNWPSPLYALWLVVAILFGARFVLARSPLFHPLWWARRGLGGILIGLGTYFAAVWLPLYLVSAAQSHGFPLSNFPSSLAIVGTLFALLAGAGYAAHPTRYYGPIEIGAGALEIFYLVVLVGIAPYAFSFQSTVISIGTLAILSGLIVVILISMAGDVVTTIEDFRRPGERRAWQYPAPRGPRGERALP